MLRRAIGWVADPTAGGSSLDVLRGDPRNRGPAAIPDPTQFWPVDTVTVNKGDRRVNRNSEIRADLDNMPEQEFKQAPVVTARGRVYMPLLKTFLRYVTGRRPTTTGVAPAAITTAYEPLGYGTVALPAMHLAVVRDDLYEKVAGCQLVRLRLDFPNDDLATWEAEFHGLYIVRTAEALPAAATDFSYLNPDWALVLRDAAAYQAGSLTAMDGLRGYVLDFNNQLREPDHHAGKNVLVVPAAGGDRERRLWYPAARRLSAARSITGQIQFWGASEAEEAKNDLARSEQFVFEVEGAPLSTTPASRQMLRSTAFNQQYTGGGPADLTREEDISATYDFGVFRSDAVGKALRFEVVDAT